MLSPTHPPSPHLNPMTPFCSAHLIVQVQPLKVAIENETLHVAVQGEICLAAVPVYTHIVPVLVIEDPTRAHRCVAGPWLDGAAA